MSVEGERSGAVVKNTDTADGDRLSVRLTTLQGVYPVPQNALYVSAGMNVLKLPKGKS